MKITSTLPFNTIVSATRTKAGKGTVASMEIPAGATIEMSDKEWAPYAKEAQLHIKSGALKFTEAPKLSKEEQDKVDAAAIAEAEAVLAKLKPAPKKDKQDK